MKRCLNEIIQKMNPFDDFDDNTDLFEEGLLDSLSIVGIISEFEKITGCIIPKEMLNIETFTSVNKIVESLQKKGIYKEL